jgi:asparagine synthase (glutamine-hydrolysing)
LINSIGKVTPEHIPYIKNHNNFPKKYHKFFEILRSKNISKMIQMKNSLFLEKELKEHIKGYDNIGITSFDKIDFNGFEEIVDEVIGTYFKTTMMDGELVKSYTAMHTHNISLSTPFLDVKLIEYMAKVPASIKIKDNIRKYILKEITHTYLPKSLMERPKSGFYIPFEEWMRNDLKEMIYSQVNYERLIKDNIFNPKSILNIRDHFYAGNSAFKYKLWRIFIFQLWYENFKK